MSRRLTVAIAGAGMISRHHLIAWSKLSSVKVAAIADPVRERAQIRADEFGIPQSFGNVAEMLDHVRPDILDIASPVETHAEMARTAAKRGIAILCQKPVAPTLGEAKALTSIASEVPFMVHENWRFRTPYRIALNWIREGRIGTVHRFAVNTQSSGLLARNGEAPPALIRQPFFANMPRLMIFEALIHHVDLARSLCGELSVVAASVTHTSPVVRGEDRAIMHLRGACSMGTVVGDYAVPGISPVAIDTVQVVGNLGQILFDGIRLALFDLDGERETQVFDREVTYQSAFDGAIRHFVECLQNGQAFETSLPDNLLTLRLVDDAYRFAEDHAG